MSSHKEPGNLFTSPNEIFDFYKHIRSPKSPNQENIPKQSPKNMFDPKLEAKKLVTDWKKIEADAEMIKQKVTSKKGSTANSGKVPQMLHKAKSKPEPLQDSKKGNNQQKEIQGKSTVSQSLNFKQQQSTKQPTNPIKGQNILPKPVHKEPRGSFGNQSSAASSLGNTLSRTANFGVLVPHQNQENVKGNIKGVEEVEDSLDYSTSLASLNLKPGQHSLPSKGHHQIKEFTLGKKDLVIDLTPEHEVRQKIFTLGPDEEDVNDKVEIPLSLDKKTFSMSPTNIKMQEKSPGSSYKKIPGREEMSLKKAKSFEDDSKRMKEVLDKLNQEHIETKLSLHKFRLDKMQTKLEKVFAQERLKRKSWAFSVLFEVFEQERAKDLKVKILRDLKIKSWCFCYLMEYVFESRFEREQKKMEKEKDTEKIMLEKAIEFYERSLLRRCFVSGFSKNYLEAKREKQLKVSQSRVKSAVSKFINQIQSKTNVTIEDEESNKNQELKEGEIREEVQDTRNEDKNMDEKEETKADRIREEETKQSERSSQRSKKEETESVGRSSKAFSQASKQESLIEKQREFENKAKQRKERQDLIKKKHDEAKAKAEQEKMERVKKEQEEIKRKKIEEKEAFERKRQEELEAIERKKKENEELQVKLKMASEFYRIQLMKKYGVGLVHRVLDLNIAREKKAYDFHRRSNKKLVLELWSYALAQIEIERDLMLVPKLKEAEKRYKAKMRQKVIKILRKQIQKLRYQESICDQYRKDVIKRHYLYEWKEVIPALRRENVVIQERNEKIINQFYYTRTLKYVFNCLKENSKEEIKNKLKQVHKDKMWEKVNSWLSDFKSKKEN